MADEQDLPGERPEATPPPPPAKKTPAKKAPAKKSGGNPLDFNRRGPEVDDEIPF